MNIHVMNIMRPQLTHCGQVMALHCSGADGTQWRNLSDTLGTNYTVLTPEHYGSESTGPWTGEHAFTLADEAERSIALIDESEEKIHLVGHSYGGGVALHIALSRPERIASMSLYEPTAFHLLRQMGQTGATAFAEINGLARHIRHCIATGDHRAGVASFVDYWNRPGTWKAMRPAAQNRLMRWAPKAPLDFQALIDDATPVKAYKTLNFPVVILRGEYAPLPTRVISERLIEILPRGRLKTIAGAGHMGPLTHASEVSRLIARHISADRNETASPKKPLEIVHEKARQYLSRAAAVATRWAPLMPLGGQNECEPRLMERRTFINRIGRIQR
jgi:pimeloyl-ACP methyl ester carboxylesterase